MHTILGAGGSIGKGLVGELVNRGKRVRLVGRNPGVVDGPVEAVSADLSNLDQTIKAVAGSLESDLACAHCAEPSHGERIHSDGGQRVRCTAEVQGSDKTDDQDCRLVRHDCAGVVRDSEALFTQREL